MDSRAPVLGGSYSELTLLPCSNWRVPDKHQLSSLDTMASHLPGILGVAYTLKTTTTFLQRRPLHQEKASAMCMQDHSWLGLQDSLPKTCAATGNGTYTGRDVGAGRQGIFVSFHFAKAERLTDMPEMMSVAVSTGMKSRSQVCPADNTGTHPSGFGQKQVSQDLVCVDRLWNCEAAWCWVNHSGSPGRGLLLAVPPIPT